MSVNLYSIIGLLMVPGILTLVPTFVWIRNLGLLNTRWALILPGIAGEQVFAIFILRAFMAGLPEELFEASARRWCGYAYKLLTHRPAALQAHPQGGGHHGDTRDLERLHLAADRD